MTLEQQLQSGISHHRAGRLAEAETIYRQILAHHPDHADVLHLLGVLAGQTGRLDEAIASYQRSIQLKPEYPEVHYNLGNTLIEKRQLDDAIASYQRAIQLKPDHDRAHYNLANALMELGRHHEAIAAFQRAIQYKPEYAQSHFNLGIAHQVIGQLDEAIASFREAARLKPDWAEAHGNLGNALKIKGQLDESIAAFRRVIYLKPDLPAAHNNLGVAFQCKGQLDQAIAVFRQAIALNPDLAEAHYNLSLALLAQGNFQQGWQEHEGRWKCQDLQPPRNFAQPQWDGSTLENRTLLLHTEQGLGDAIQFIRYLPLLQQSGGRIIIECQAELQRLFQTMAGGCQIVPRGRPLPAFDLHCPLLSLPRVFETNLANIPNNVPYLHADSEDAKRWQHRLADHFPLLKVGLAWAGNPIHKNDRNRSMNLVTLAPMGQLPGARFFSLQKGAAAAQAKTPPSGLELIDWTQELNDFADTAAFIANLDLVIAVDTAVAHLAGAMDKPVWTLLPFVADWRWLAERQDSPWYPSMRLFRQPREGDWHSIIAPVAQALSQWISG